MIFISINWGNKLIPPTLLPPNTNTIAQLGQKLPLCGQVDKTTDAHVWRGGGSWATAERSEHWGRGCISGGPGEEPPATSWQLSQLWWWKHRRQALVFSFLNTVKMTPVGNVAAQWIASSFPFLTESYYCISTFWNHIWTNIRFIFLLSPNSQLLLM